MRKLKLQVQMSVDGIVGGPSGEMDFLARNWDAGIIQYVTALTSPQRLRLVKSTAFDCGMIVLHYEPRRD